MKDLRGVVPSAITYLRKIQGRSNQRAYWSSRRPIRPGGSLESNGSGPDLSQSPRRGLGDRFSDIMSRVVRDIAGICVVDRTVGEARLGNKSMPVEIRSDSGFPDEVSPILPTICIDGVEGDQAGTFLGTDTIPLSQTDSGSVPPDGKNTGRINEFNLGTLFEKKPDTHVNTVTAYGCTSRLDAREIAWEARSLLSDVRQYYGFEMPR